VPYAALRGLLSTWRRKVEDKRYTLPPVGIRLSFAHAVPSSGRSAWAGRGAGGGPGASFSSGAPSLQQGPQHQQELFSARRICPVRFDAQLYHRREPLARGGLALCSGSERCVGGCGCPDPLLALRGSDKGTELPVTSTQSLPILPVVFPPRVNVRPFVAGPIRKTAKLRTRLAT